MVSARILVISLLALALSTGASFGAEPPAEPPATDETLATALLNADLVVEAEVISVVKGTPGDIAALRVSDVLKGPASVTRLHLVVPQEPIEALHGPPIEETRGIWILHRRQDAPAFDLLAPDGFLPPGQKEMLVRRLNELFSAGPEDLRLEVVIAQQDYAEDEPIRVVLTLRNAGTKHLIFEATPPAWGFNFGYALTRLGGPATPVASRVADGTPFGPYPGPTFSTLAPGASHSVTFNLLRALAIPDDQTDAKPLYALEQGSYQLITTADMAFAKQKYADLLPRYAATPSLTSAAVTFNVNKPPFDNPADAIAAIERASGITDLKTSLTGEDPEARRAAADAVALYAPPQALDLVPDMLRSPDLAVLDAGFSALYTLLGHPRFPKHSILQPFLANLDWNMDPERLTRITGWTANVASRQNDTTCLPVLLEFFKSESVEEASKKNVLVAISALTGLDFEIDVTQEKPAETIFEERIETIERWIQEHPDKVSPPSESETNTQ